MTRGCKGKTPPHPMENYLLKVKNVNFQHETKGALDVWIKTLLYHFLLLISTGLPHIFKCRVLKNKWLIESHRFSHFFWYLLIPLSSWLSSSLSSLSFSRLDIRTDISTQSYKQKIQLVRERFCTTLLPAATPGTRVEAHGVTGLSWGGSSSNKDGAGIAGNASSHLPWKGLLKVLIYNRAGGWSNIEVISSDHP